MLLEEAEELLEMSEFELDELQFEAKKLDYRIFETHDLIQYKQEQVEKMEKRLMIMERDLEDRDIYFRDTIE